jgi:hypothetical protein
MKKVNKPLLSGLKKAGSSMEEQGKKFAASGQTKAAGKLAARIAHRGPLGG